MAMRKPNKFAHMADGTVIVMLERRDGTALPCFIDAGDWPKVRGYRWCAAKDKRNLYAQALVRKAESGRKTLGMHRLLMPATEDVDHRDGNGLNNRRTNLRSATDSQNRANSRKPILCTSDFKGVSWHKATKKWQGRIRVNDRKIYLGIFTSELDAARAYDAAALQHFGEFARLNFPLEQAA